MVDFVRLVDILSGVFIGSFYGSSRFSSVFFLVVWIGSGLFVC